MKFAQLISRRRIFILKCEKFTDKNNFCNEFTVGTAPIPFLVKQTKKISRVQIATIITILLLGVVEMGRSFPRDSKTDFLCQCKYDTMKIPLCLIATSAGYGQTFTASGYVSAYVKDSSKTNSNTAVCIQVFQCEGLQIYIL